MIPCVTKHNTAHELLHTPLFGSMRHVNDPVNLMWTNPTVANTNILRHREINHYDVGKDGVYYKSQWEELRNLNNLFN